MSAKALASGLVKSLITTLIFFTIAEVVLRGAYAARNAMVRRVPLPYALGDEYGPIPPWLDRLMILVPDDRLLWHSLPNVRRTYVDIFSPVRSEAARIALLRRFLPTLPPEFRGNPTWQIALNSHGDRTSEYAAAKAPTAVRVACIGDSWTFGMNVNQDQTYPGRLAADLRDAQHDTAFEVLNFGVLGYSSFQGLQLLKARVLALQPDVLAIGFGMNDSEVAGYRDREMVTPEHLPVSARLKERLPELEFWKLMNYAVLAAKFHSKPIDSYLREEAAGKSGPIDYDAIDPWTRVSPRDYEANVREMIRLQTDRGGRVVLLDNELWEGSPYRPVLHRISADLGVPLVDSVDIVAQARARMEREMEARMGLAASEGGRSLPLPDGGGAPPPLRTDADSSPAPPAPPVSVVFRVWRGAYDVPRAMSIVGPHPQLGDAVPNTVLMRDDGMGGDERAGDGVWSYTATFPAGSQVFYVYTNSGARGQWEGLDVPSIRRITVPAVRDEGRLYLPIDTFGRLYMQADNWHTDAAGYDLIARAVADAIERTDRKGR